MTTQSAMLERIKEAEEQARKRIAQAQQKRDAMIAAARLKAAALEETERARMKKEMEQQIRAQRAAVERAGAKDADGGAAKKIAAAAAPHQKKAAVLVVNACERILAGD